MENQISIQKTMRYYTYGNPKTAKNIWIVLHGYGQLPHFFIRKFHALLENEHFIVAPEGLHRFYLEGNKGRVGASWMTKEARLDDIEDNIRYLDQLYLEISEKYNFKNKILLGFSQGGATASRWHHRGNFRADHFILWASIFADDISLAEDQKGMLASNNYFAIGNKDEYFQDKMEETLQKLTTQQFNIKIKPFEGQHNIQKEMLLEIAKEISI